MTDWLDVYQNIAGLCLFTQSKGTLAKAGADRNFVHKSKMGVNLRDAKFCKGY